MLLVIDSPLHKRSALSTLDQLKAAYSSPSACIHSDWCRIPMAVVIFFFLVILFTCFCCWAQCVACCCCSGSKSKRRGSDYGQGANLLGTTSYGHRQGGLPSMPEYPIAMNELKTPKFAVIGDDGSVTTDVPKSATADQATGASQRSSQVTDQPTLPLMSDEKEAEASGWASAETNRPHLDQRLPRFGAQPPPGPPRDFHRPGPPSTQPLQQPNFEGQTYNTDPYARQPRFGMPTQTGFDNRPPRSLPQPPIQQQLSRPIAGAPHPRARQQQQQQQQQYGARPAQQSYASNNNRFMPSGDRQALNPARPVPMDRSMPFDQRPPPLVAPQPRAPAPDWPQQQEPRFPSVQARSATPTRSDGATLPPYPADSPDRSRNDSRNDSRDDVNDIFGHYEHSSGRY